MLAQRAAWGATVLASCCFSRNLMIRPAISFSVAFSTPSSPGDELTSRTSGPREERMRSTPATFNPTARVACRASSFSSFAKFDDNRLTTLVKVRAEFTFCSGSHHCTNNCFANHQAREYLNHQLLRCTLAPKSLHPTCETLQ